MENTNNEYLITLVSPYTNERTTYIVTNNDQIGSDVEGPTSPEVQNWVNRARARAQQNSIVGSSNVPNVEQTSETGQNRQ